MIEKAEEICTHRRKEHWGRINAFSHWYVVTAVQIRRSTSRTKVIPRLQVTDEESPAQGSHTSAEALSIAILSTRSVYQALSRPPVRHRAGGSTISYHKRESLSISPYIRTRRRKCLGPWWRLSMCRWWLRGRRAQYGCTQKRL